MAIASEIRGFNPEEEEEDGPEGEGRSKETESDIGDIAELLKGVDSVIRDANMSDAEVGEQIWIKAFIEKGIAEYEQEREALMGAAQNFEPDTFQPEDYPSLVKDGIIFKEVSVAMPRAEAALAKLNDEVEKPTKETEALRSKLESFVSGQKDIITAAPEARRSRQQEEQRRVEEEIVKYYRDRIAFLEQGLEKIERENPRVAKTIEELQATERDQRRKKEAAKEAWQQALEQTDTALDALK